jgi:O-antigen/teichoic acid export membrane protein
MVRIFQKKESLLTGLSVLIPVIIQLYFMRYVSYNISLDIYGDYVLLLVLVSGCNLIGMTLVQSSAVRFYHESSKKREFIGEQAMLVIVSSFLFLPVFIIYFFMYDEYSISIGFMLFCYFLFYNILLLAKSMVLQALKRELYLLFVIAEAFSNFILPLVFFKIWPTLEGLVFGIAMGSFFSALCVYLLTKRMYISFSKIKYTNINIYFKYSYPFVFSSMGSWLVSFSDRYFIDWLLSSSATGTYALLSQFGGFIAIIGGFISIYINPLLLSEYQVNRHNTIRKYKKYVVLILALLIIVSLVAVTLPNFIYTLLLPESVIFENGNFMVMAIIFFSIATLVLANFVGNYFILEKRTKVIVPIWFIAAFLNVVGNFFLIPIYGLYGAALSTLLAYITVCFFFIGYVILFERSLKIRNMHD